MAYHIFEFLCFFSFLYRFPNWTPFERNESIKYANFDQIKSVSGIRKSKNYRNQEFIHIFFYCNIMRSQSQWNANNTIWKNELEYARSSCATSGVVNMSRIYEVHIIKKLNLGTKSSRTDHSCIYYKYTTSISVVQWNIPTTNT